MWPPLVTTRMTNKIPRDTKYNTNTNSNTSVHINYKTVQSDVIQIWNIRTAYGQLYNIQLKTISPYEYIVKNESILLHNTAFFKIHAHRLNSNGLGPVEKHQTRMDRNRQDQTRPDYNRPERIESDSSRIDQNQPDSTPLNSRLLDRINIHYTLSHTKINQFNSLLLQPIRLPQFHNTTIPTQSNSILN